MADPRSALLMLWKLILLLLESNLVLCMALQRNMHHRQLLVSAMHRLARRRWARRGFPRRKLRSRRTSLMAQWLALAEASQHPRRWVIPRSTEWWDGFVRSAWADEPWLEHFRMTRGTFCEIVEVVTPRLRRTDTHLRKPIPVDKRVAIALWFLSGKTCYRKVREQFGVGLSTVAEIVMEVCSALRVDLLSETVCLGESVGTIMDGFAKLGFPHCIGAVDSTRIQIRAHRGRGGEYINHKQYCSVLLQGTVDHTGRFIDAAIVWSGENHSEFVCQSSDLFKAMDAGSFVPGNPTISLGGVQVPALIVADGALYPIRRWLMKPYGQCWDQRRRTFDRALSRARNVVESAFGRLKSRWRCLQNRLEVSEANVESIITACVILHNICEQKGHAILGELCASDALPSPPALECHEAEDSRHQKEGERVRDAIADFLLLQQGGQAAEEEEEERGPEGQGQAEDPTAVEDAPVSEGRRKAHLPIHSSGFTS